MRPASMKKFLFLAFAIAYSASATRGSAGELDLTLANFLDCPADGANCRALNQRYETFLSEYIFGISPKILAPADTLGYSGFYMGFEGSMMVRPLGNAAEDRWQRGTASNEVQTVVWNPGVHVRKGFPHFFGQPWSIEMGSTVNFLALSELVTVGGEVKVSVFEGYHSGWKGALPDLSFRGSVVRALGEADLDLTIIAADASLSYSFGVAGAVNLTPYAGYQITMSIVNTEPMLYYDGSQYHSQTTRTVNGRSTEYWDTTALGSPFLIRHHAFFGFRLNFELLSYTMELEWALPRRWDTEADDAETEVGHQFKLSGGLGVDF